MFLILLCCSVSTFYLINKCVRVTTTIKLLIHWFCHYKSKYLFKICSLQYNRNLHDWYNTLNTKYITKISRNVCFCTLWQNRSLAKFNNSPKSSTGLPILLLQRPVLLVQWPTARPQRTWQYQQWQTQPWWAVASASADASCRQMLQHLPTTTSIKQTEHI